MSRVNGHVKMGEPIKVRAVRMESLDDFEPRPMERLGRIYNLGEIQGLQINQAQAVGLIGGGGLLMGSVFTKGPTSTIMAVLGALGLGTVVLSIFYNVIQQLPTGAPAPSTPQAPPGYALVPSGQAAALAPGQYAAPPPPPPPPKPTRTQTYTAIATQAAPVAAELIKGLVSLF